MRPVITVHPTKTFDKVKVCADGPFGYAEMIFVMSFGEFCERYNRWESGEMVQRAFNTSSKEEREFLLTGMCLVEQEEVFDDDPFTNHVLDFLQPNRLDK